MNTYTVHKKIPENHELLSQYSPLIAQLLINRNIDNLKKAEQFLNPKFEDNHDPFLLYNMEKSIQRFYTAIQKNEKITIYADYDADGIPGAIVLANLLEKINYKNYNIYIPHRHNEGYGIHIAALEKIKKTGTTLIITIDVGITAHEAGTWSLEKNIDIIITDHHTPILDEHGEQIIPESFSLINPKQTACQYPDSMLCGCGVIFKFVQAFVQKHANEFKIHEGWEKWLLDMVSISTISDMVPLRNENRIFAYFGMKVIEAVCKKNNHRHGLKKLIWDSGINSQYITEEDIAFSITPKINAASRMSHPEDAVAVFMANDTVTATHSVKHLVNLNNERKKLVKNIMSEVDVMLENVENPNIIVIGKETWQAGVLGLVASKVVEQYKVPVFVWSREHDEIKGSCRSLNGIHLVEIMTLTKDSFTHYGGHKEAGGFSCKLENISKLPEQLERALNIYQKQNTHEQITPLFIDMELTLDEITKENYKHIRKLAPFGIGNDKPLFVIKNVLIDTARTFGKDQNHLEIFMKNTLGKTIRGIAFFKTPNDFEKLHEGQICNIIANIEYSVFIGKHELRLKIVDIL